MNQSLCCVAESPLAFVLRRNCRMTLLLSGHCWMMGGAYIWCRNLWNFFFVLFPRARVRLFFLFSCSFVFFVLRHRWVSHIFATWAQGGGSGPYLNAAVRLHSFKQEFCKVITKHLPAKTLKCLFDWKTNHFSFLFTFWGAETLSLNLWKTVVHFSWNVLGCHGLPLLKQEIWSLIHAALLS